MALALQALWKGLLYDDDALDEALRLAPRHDDRGDALALRERVARDGLARAPRGRGRVGACARAWSRLAVEGLKRVAPDETGYLDVLVERVVEDGVCPADILLRNCEGSWHGSMERVFEHLRVA